jgi:hypothetical protein
MEMGKIYPYKRKHAPHQRNTQVNKNKRCRIQCNSSSLRQIEKEAPILYGGAPQVEL